MPKTDYPDIIIRNHHERRLLKGHLWAFSNELLEVKKDIPAGSVIRLIRAFDNKPFALAFYHPNSLISARIISRNPNDTIDRDYIKTRIAEAIERRKPMLKERNAVRLVHSESDLLPGLVIEQYDRILTFQIVSAGMELFKDEIISILKELLSPETIIEKNSSYLRTLEGLPELEAVVFGSITIANITDRTGTKFNTSLLEGQKTGFYLDQMDNRTLIRRYINAGSKVLDLFCNEGGFALNAALAGAESVVAVDSSEHALTGVKQNMELNGITTITPVKADCFTYLDSNKSSYDMVITDPPSLAKSKKHIATAKKAYTNLHRSAIKALNKEGILVTASCSHNVSREDFLDTIRTAASLERRSVVILEESGAAPDHPVLLTMPETEYLKLFVLKVY